MKILCNTPDKVRRMKNARDALEEHDAKKTQLLIEWKASCEDVFDVFNRWSEDEEITEPLMKVQKIQD